TLTITPPANSSEDFTLTVTATSSEDGTTAQTVAELNVNVTGVADTPDLTVADASGVAGVAIPLDISANLTDTDGSESLSITIAGVPTGAILSAGTDNGDGTWTISSDEIANGALDNLTITPPANSDADFALTVTATSSEDGTFATRTQTLNVDVEAAAVADTPTLRVALGTPTTHQGATTYPLEITAALTDTDGSETLSITIAGVPEGATLSAGTHNPDGTWTLTADQLSGLTLTTPRGSPVGQDGFNLSVTATATETVGGDTASTSASIILGSQGNPETIVGSDGNDWIDGRSGQDTINAGAGDDTVIGGEGVDFIDGGAGNDTLVGSQGADTILGGDGDDNIQGGQGDDILIGGAGNDRIDGGLGLDTAVFEGNYRDYTVAINADGTITVTSPNGDVDTLTGIERFQFADMTLTRGDLDGVEDPVLNAGNVTGGEDTAIPLNITAALGDPDETATMTIVIAGVPNGATLSAGTDNGDGTWTLTPDQLKGLAITPPKDFYGEIDLRVTATASEDGTSASRSETL
ncbi:MAG: hypothetical protein FJX37_12285, partial [Alphaproteobacteria bacterium]|nr:hypothetical protein [Alphaproteobacteria bacterium]